MTNSKLENPIRLCMVSSGLGLFISRVTHFPPPLCSRITNHYSNGISSDKQLTLKMVNLQMPRVCSSIFQTGIQEVSELLKLLIGVLQNKMVLLSYKFGKHFKTQEQKLSKLKLRGKKKTKKKKKNEQRISEM